MLGHPMICRCSVIFALAVTAACGQANSPPAVKPADAAAPAIPPPSANVLMSVPAGPNSPLRYELAIEACVANKCPFTVHLSKTGQLLSSQPLPWPSTGQQTNEEDIDGGWGAGDLLLGTSEGKAFASGEEATYMAVYATVVHLAAAQWGFLVTQRGGWEHLKHHHELFLVSGSTLRSAWSATDGNGPTWSSTEVIRGSTLDQVLYFSGFQSPSTDITDTLSVSSIQWDEQKQDIVVLPVKEMKSLNFVLLGRYPSIAKAQSARTAAALCATPPLWVLDSKAYAAVGGKFFLATMTSDRVSAEQTVATLQDCLKKTATVNFLPYEPNT